MTTVTPPANVQIPPVADLTSGADHRVLIRDLEHRNITVLFCYALLENHALANTLTVPDLCRQIIAIHEEQTR